MGHSLTITMSEVAEGDGAWEHLIKSISDRVYEVTFADVDGEKAITARLVGADAWTENGDPELLFYRWENDTETDIRLYLRMSQIRTLEYC